MPKYKMITLHSNKGTLRNKEVIGELISGPPELDKPVRITAPPINPAADIRIVITSHVVQIDDLEDGWKFLTETGSIYQLTKQTGATPVLTGEQATD